MFARDCFVKSWLDSSWSVAGLSYTELKANSSDSTYGRVISVLGFNG
jgi:hypothetical protein